jgi:serine/threonine-protein kinase
MPEPTPGGSDRNLLFGILALQMDFIGRDALIAALHAWVLDKGRPLGQILVEQGELTPERAHLLDALVGEHLKAHQDDPQQSLATLGPLPASVRADLLGLSDDVLSVSLAGLVSARSTATQATVDRPDTLGGASAPAVRYRVLRPHAKGGLGEVFVAEDRELHREVALKEIQARHADDPVSRRRFLLEAEVTGNLEHPGIVPVYGLGVYPDGRPFYAMRLIKGDSLKEAIARFHNGEGAGLDPGQRRLAFRELLGRFVDVCQAVAYAHSRGVLHRDLKPGNVMLGKFGETLVVDWGLAKPVGRPEAAGGDEASLWPDSGSGMVRTGAGVALGTPAFMSPEQAEGRTDELGPASDVYSLGATLYVLLTGKPPFAGADAGAILGKVQRGEFAPPRRVRPDVAPALDAVCRKAMALRPGDRYASALELAADVEHWLADEPVGAWPEPLAQRARRWVRRHRLAVTGAAAALLVAALSFAVATVLLTRAYENEYEAKLLAQGQEQEAARQRDLARDNFKLAQEAVDRMLTQVGQALADTPQAEMLRRLLLKEALEFQKKFLKQKGTDPAVRQETGRAYRRVAGIYSLLGQKDEAEKAYRAALTYQRELAAEFPAEPAYRDDLMPSCNGLGVLFFFAGRNREAEQVWREELALLEDRPGGPAGTAYRNRLGKLLNNLANVQSRTGRLKEAERGYLRALELHQQLLDESPKSVEYRQDLAAHHLSLGVLQYDQGRNREAEDSFRRAAGHYQELVKAYPWGRILRHELAISHFNRGNALKALGLTGEAEKAYRRALALRQKLATDFPSVPEYQQDLARTFDFLGTLLGRGRNREEAKKFMRQAVPLWERLAKDFPAMAEYRASLASSHNNLGVVLQDLGEVNEAEQAYLRAAALEERLAAGSPGEANYRRRLFYARRNVARLLLSAGRFEEGKRAYRQALDVGEQLVADFPRETAYRKELADGNRHLAEQLVRRGAVAEAEPLCRQAVAHRERLAAAAPGKPRPQEELAEGNHLLGYVLQNQGRRREAEQTYRKVVDVQTQLAARFPGEPARRQGLADAYALLAQLLADDGRREEAEKAYRQALELRERLAADAPGSPDARHQLAESLAVLGLALRRWGERARACELLEKAVGHHRALLEANPRHADYRLALRNNYSELGRTLAWMGKPADAERVYREAVDLFEKRTAEFPDLPAYRSDLGGLLSDRAMVFQGVGDHARARLLLEQAIEHQRAALRADAKHPTFLRFLGIHYHFLAVSLAALGEHAELARMAAEFARDCAQEKNSVYNAACYLARCVPLAEKDAKLPEAQRQELARSYADRALDTLRRAVQSGYKDVARIKKDPDLDPLRRRPDFQQLLQDLEKEK